MRSSADSSLTRVEEDPVEVEGAPAHATGATEIAAFPAGRPPFGDRSLFGVATAPLEDDPPEPPTSAAVSWALFRALEKDPAARPSTATMYAHLLGSASPG